MPGYRLPEASASAAAHHEACPSSLARERQIFEFSKDHGLEGLTAGGAAARGTDLHSIAAKLPFASPDFGDEPYEVRPVADVLCKADGYGGYDSFLITDFVKRRDQAINYALDHFPGGRGSVETLEILLDEKRLHAVFSIFPYSGLPDVLVIARGAGHSTAVVADYKSGQSVRKHASENRQIVALVGLVKHNYPDVTEVYGAVIAENEVGADVALAHFDKKQVEMAELFIERVARNVGMPLNIYLRGGHSDPSPGIDQRLNELAKPGEHCLDCRGRTCCEKLHEKLVTDYFEKLDVLMTLIPTSKIDPTMNPNKLSEILALSTAVTETAKLYNRVREDAETLVLQLHEKGIGVPGADVTSGAGRISLTENDLPKLHAALEPALKGQSLIDFALAVAKPSATAVRTHISSLLSVPESKVEPHLNTLLGEKENPLKKGTPPQSVTVTRDLADILDEKHAAIKGAVAPSTPVAVLPAAPIPSPSVPAIVEPPPIKTRRRRTTVSEPSIEPAEIAVPAAAQRSGGVALL